MKTICSWCRCELGETEGDGLSPGEVSHGICGTCAEFFKNNSGVGLRSFIERLGAPVLIVNERIRVEAQNAASVGGVRDLAMPDVEGLLLGEILECSRARLPEGCGGVHVCVMGCALRHAILTTLETGRPMENMVAEQEIGTGRGARVMRFWFSTARVDGRVVLRFDRVEKVSRRQGATSGSGARGPCGITGLGA